MKTGSGELRKEGRDCPMDFQRASVLFKRQTWCCSVHRSAACLNGILLFRRERCFQPCCNPVQQHVPWFGCLTLSLDAVRRWGSSSGEWCVPCELWNALFQAEHAHAWSDSCGNWTLQVVRIFQSLAGRTCLNPLNFSKRGAGGRLRSWQGNSGSRLALQARLAERAACAKPLCSGI